MRRDEIAGAELSRAARDTMEAQGETRVFTFARASDGSLHIENTPTTYDQHRARGWRPIHWSDVSPTAHEVKYRVIAESTSAERNIVETNVETRVFTFAREADGSLRVEGSPATYEQHRAQGWQPIYWSDVSPTPREVKYRVVAEISSHVEPEVVEARGAETKVFTFARANDGSLHIEGSSTTYDQHRAQGWRPIYWSDISPTPHEIKYHVVMEKGE